MIYRVLRNSFFVALIRGLGVIAMFSSTTLLASKANLAVSGYFVWLLSFLNLSAVFLSLGLDQFIPRMLKSGESRAYGNAVFKIIISVIFIIFFCYFLLSVTGWLTKSNISLFLAVALFFLVNILPEFFRGVGRFVEYALFKGVFHNVLIFLFICFSGQVNSGNDIDFLVNVSLILSVGLQFIVLLKVFGKELYSYTSATSDVNYRLLISSSVQLQTVGVMQALYSIASVTFIARYFVSEEELGILGLMSQLALVVTFALSAVNQVVSIDFVQAKEAHLRKNIFHKVQLWTTIFALIFTIPAYFAFDVVASYLNIVDLDKGPLLVLLSAGVFNALLGPIAPCFVMTGREKILAKTMFKSGVFIMPLCLFLIGSGEPIMLSLAAVVMIVGWKVPAYRINMREL